MVIRMHSNPLVVYFHKKENLNVLYSYPSKAIYFRPSPPRPPRSVPLVSPHLNSPLSPPTTAFPHVIRPSSSLTFLSLPLPTYFRPSPPIHLSLPTCPSHLAPTSAHLFLSLCPSPLLALTQTQVQRKSLGHKHLTKFGLCHHHPHKMHVKV